MGVLTPGVFISNVVLEFSPATSRLSFLNLLPKFALPAQIEAYIAAEVDPFEAQFVNARVGVFPRL